MTRATQQPDLTEVLEVLEAWRRDVDPLAQEQTPRSGTDPRAPGGGAAGEYLSLEDRQRVDILTIVWAG
jgi:hypothetical protein